MEFQPQHQLEFSIKDFRAIANADIAIDGITVLAGENGSGKSTISKLVYHILRTTIKYPDYINSDLLKEIEDYQQAISQVVREFKLLTEEDFKFFNTKVPKVNSSEFEQFSSIEVLIENFHKLNFILEDNFFIEKYKSSDSESEVIKKVLTRYNRIVWILNQLTSEKNNIPIKNIIDQIIKKLKKINSDYFDILQNRPVKFFYQKIQEIFSEDTINYRISEYDVPLIDTMTDSLLVLNSIENIAYIDTPMSVGITNRILHWTQLQHILFTKSFGKSSFNNFIKTDIIKGDVDTDDSPFSRNSFKYKRIDGKEFDLLDCATGLKSFAILQMMLKNGFLNKKTLLVIDEPEAHLHPQWVVEYARTMVFLNKTLGVKFLIASHHPDMISAIKYISEKEGINENVNFYLAVESETPFKYNFKHLGNDIEEIFASFNIAIERIDKYGTTA